MPRSPKNEAFYTGHAVPLVLASPVDEWLSELDGATLTWQDLPRILRAHGRITDLFKSISGRAQRSLASKYLHFHRPELFFIFDSRADSAVRAECRNPRQVDVEGYEVDPDYALFSRRCLELLAQLGPHCPVPMGPRELDRYFLEY